MPLWIGQKGLNTEMSKQSIKPCEYCQLDTSVTELKTDRFGNEICDFCRVAQKTDKQFGTNYPLFGDEE